MSALRDPKREKFAQSLARLTAEGVAAGDAAVRAGIEANYPSQGGRSFAPNCRKRANRPDVKARVAELLKPGLEQAEKEIEITVEWAIGKLAKIVEYGDAIPKTSDQIAAIQLIGRMKNWAGAAERHEHSGPNGEPIATADVSDVERAKALANFIARTRATTRPEAA
jgi:hypothetical protein